jgi:spore coat protein U-like protein
MAGLAVVAAAGVASPAVAQEHAIAATFSKLDAVLTGRIADRCELAGGGEINFGELTGRETAVAQLALNCNVPFQLGLQSARGGLTHTTLPRGQGPFAGQLGYTVDIRVPTLSPRPAVLQGSFHSAELQTRRTLSSGEAIAAGGGRLEFTTLMPDGAGLLAGKYSETLTVTLTPNL